MGFLLVLVDFSWCLFFLDFRHLSRQKKILQHRGGHPLHEWRRTMMFHSVLLSELALRPSQSLYRQCQEERGETSERQKKEIWKDLLKHIKHTVISRTNIPTLPLEAVISTCKVKKAFKYFRWCMQTERQSFLRNHKYRATCTLPAGILSASAYRNDTSP